MRIGVCCATRRGYRFIERLTQLASGLTFTVFSFREEEGEPPFFDDIRSLTHEHGGCFYEVRNIGHPLYADLWAAESIDLLFAVSWRYLIPQKIYLSPRLGSFVFHDSYLPDYRGFSPTVWAIINGEDHTGVTLFAMAEECDAGDIVDQERVSIDPDETIATVIERVTSIYLTLLERNLQALMTGTTLRTPQDHSLATYTCKRLATDNLINWSSDTTTIYNLIRAVTHPYQGAYTFFAGARLRIWTSERDASGYTYIGRIPGRVLDIRPGIGVVVATGDGSLLITRVQKDDGDVVCASHLITSLSATLGGVV